MRRLMVLSVLVCLLAGLVVLPVGAQGSTLAIGDVVQGELTAEVPEIAYTFEGTAGTIIMAEMTVGYEFSLDPALKLLDASGGEIANNDDFSGLDLLILVELPADGTYTLVAGRSSMSDPEEWGPFTLSLRAAQTLELGGSVTATVLADYEVNMPTYFVVKPAEAGTWAIAISQPGGELAAGVMMTTFPDQNYVFDLSELAGLRTATLNVDVEAGMMYVITVDQSMFSFTSAVESIDVVLSAAPAQ